MNQPLAYVHPGAKIAKNVVIEPFTTIHNNVVIGDGTWIGSNVTIMEGALIGKNCNINKMINDMSMSTSLLRKTVSTIH
jgi:UDP-N-acetylglucosamine acyltransferase